ncbi:hypothetical protein JW859_14580 [bacterium]|nr:hypothetical protein [bacterium]
MSEETAGNLDEQQLEAKLKSYAPRIKKLLVRDEQEAAVALLTAEGIEREIAIEFVAYLRDIFKIDVSIGPGEATTEPIATPAPAPSPAPARPAAPAESRFERPEHIARRQAEQAKPDPTAPLTAEPARAVKPQLKLDLNQAPAATPDPPAPPRPESNPQPPRQEPVPPPPPAPAPSGAPPSLDDVTKLKANIRRLAGRPKYR